MSIVLQMCSAIYCRFLQQCAIGTADAQFKRYISDLCTKTPSKDATYLASTNMSVDIYNAEKLGKHEGTLWCSTAKDTGRVKVLSAILGARKKLYLKVGVPVIITANLSDTLINGTRATVLKLDKEQKYVTIKVDGDGSIHHIQKFTFLKRSSGMVHSREQFPLKLSWALTIHRSQGLTLDAVHVDCTGLQSYCHLYVAMARTRSSEMLSLSNLNLKAISAVDDEVLAFTSTGQVPSLVSFVCL